MTAAPDDPDSGPALQPPPVLRVTVTDGRGRLRAAGALPEWLAGVAPRAARGEMTVALVGDAKMRALNRQFRGIDRPTDVLSFPAAPDAPAAPESRRWLGDVVIATGVARRQARARGCGEDVEYCRLALHGLLHLLGYDHTRDDGRMERLERRLWRKGGLAGEAL